MPIITHNQQEYNTIQQINLRNLTKKDRISAVYRVIFDFKVSKIRKVKVFVIPTNEELAIAKDTLALVK